MSLAETKFYDEERRGDPVRMLRRRCVLIRFANERLHGQKLTGNNIVLSPRRQLAEMNRPEVEI